MVRLLPLLLPARPSCACGLEAVLPPTTTAPTGRPRRNPGTPVAGVPGAGSPVKKYPAREKPNRAVLRNEGEKTCVPSMLATCARRVTTSALNGLSGVAGKTSPASGVLVASRGLWAGEKWLTRA